MITSKTDVANGQDFTFVVLDPNVGDINGNHVGIDVDSVVSFASKGINLKSGRQMTDWIKVENIDILYHFYFSYDYNQGSIFVNLLRKNLDKRTLQKPILETQNTKKTSNVH